MAIAVSVMFFVAALVWLGIAFSEREPISILMFLVSVAAGVLNLVMPNVGIHITVGILAFVEAIWCLVLMFYCFAAGDGDNVAASILATIGAFLLFAWAVTFGILQLTIVV